MELEFNKINDMWESEFKATTDFNLHIEGVPEGKVSVFQKSIENAEYAFVRTGTHSPSLGLVYDHDFSAILYPKYVKVSCPSEPSMAVLTEPEKPIEIISYHFEFNDLELGGDLLMGEWLDETQEGDFSSVYNKVLTFLKEHGEPYENNYYIYDQELISKYIDITFNGYKPIGISYYGSSIMFEFDGPSNPHNATYGELYEDRVYFSTVPE